MSFAINLSALQQRILAVTLALLPAIALVVLVVGTVLQWSAHHSEVAILKQQLADYQNLVRTAPEWRRDIEAMRSATASNRYFFTADQSSQAAGEVRAKAVGIVTKNGGTVQQSNVELKVAGENEPTAYHATISFSADIAALTRILYQLRRTRPYLFATQLAIHSSAPAISTTMGPNRLQVDLVVVGFWQSR
jgi:hypothetical protein